MTALKTSIRRLVYRVADAISPKLPALSDTERQYLSQLKAEVLTAAAGDPNGEWTKNLALLRESILQKDPRSFLRWPVVMRTMAATQERYILPELWFLLRHNWKRWRSVINELLVGHPYRCLFYPASSGNLIHQTYHLATFEKATGKSISDLKGIVEFGGGYGCLCRTTRRLGYTGPYLIFDFPAFSALQRYYLRTNGIEDVTYVSDPAALRSAIKAMSNQREILFVATWSLSETPIETREIICREVDTFGYFLVAYQSNFEGIDNDAFFSDMISRRGDVAWTKLPIRHLPANTYLIGKPR